MAVQEHIIDTELGIMHVYMNDAKHAMLRYEREDNIQVNRVPIRAYASVARYPEGWAYTRHDANIPGSVNYRLMDCSRTDYMSRPGLQTETSPACKRKVREEMLRAFQTWIAAHPEAITAVTAEVRRERMAEITKELRELQVRMSALATELNTLKSQGD